MIKKIIQIFFIIIVASCQKEKNPGNWADFGNYSMKNCCFFEEKVIEHNVDQNILFNELYYESDSPAGVIIYLENKNKKGRRKIILEMHYYDNLANTVKRVYKRKYLKSGMITTISEYNEKFIPQKKLESRVKTYIRANVWEEQIETNFDPQGNIKNKIYYENRTIEPPGEFRYSQKFIVKKEYFKEGKLVKTDNTLMEVQQ